MVLQVELLDTGDTVIEAHKDGSDISGVRMYHFMIQPLRVPVFGHFSWFWKLGGVVSASPV